MHNIKFYLTPHDAWEAIYQDCANASTSIECEQYIVSASGIGLHLMELFAHKARENLHVSVMLDRIGSRDMVNAPVVEELQRYGGEIYFYNHLEWRHLLQPWLWFPRDHAKTILIDSKIAYTGGVCFDQKMAKWRDTQVRMTGPIIQQIRNEFDHLWHRFKGRGNSYAEYNHPLKDIHYVVSAPTLGHNAIYEELKYAVTHAKRYVYLTSPFFIPDEIFTRILTEATKRGVEVKLLVTHNSDASIADFASQSYFDMLLHKGIRIFMYEKQLLHAKSIVVDDIWATVGSTNLDYLSFYRNREANLIVRDKAIIQQLTEHFREDLTHSHEVVASEWQKRPLMHKIKAYMSRCIGWYL